MSSVIAIQPHMFQRHAARAASPSIEDLYVQAWLDDQSAFLSEATVAFFQFRVNATGELVMSVFGSGILVTHRDKVLAITALSVAEQFGHGETFMQTSLGAVSMNREVCRLDRGQGVAVGDVDQLVRTNAVLPSLKLPIISSGGHRGAESVLCLGFPGAANAFRKSRRPSSFEAKALMVPYSGGNHVRTTVTEPLFLEWGQKAEIRGHGRSEADIDHDPKGMIGGPVFEVVRDGADELSSRLLAVAVEHKRDQGVVIAARVQTIASLLDRTMARSF